MDSVLVSEVCPTAVYLPNVFSPNEDGVNDHFEVFGKDIISMHLRVYDRWGNRVFSTRSQDEAWDGNYLGQKARSGIYIWTLELEGIARNGDVFEEVREGELYLMR